MILVEKYRPQSFDEVVGQQKIVNSIKRILEREDVPHFLFVGIPGVGKTTIAQCIAHEIFGDDWKRYYTELNASDERGIDTIRDKVKRLSRIKGKRILLLDEADSLTRDAQQAMRRIMEKTKGTIFILTGNREWKIIDAIKSRCTIHRFRRLSNKQVLSRIVQICKQEGLASSLKEKKVREGLVHLAKRSKGDLRTALNTLEKCLDGKGISVEAIVKLEKPKIAVDAMLKALDGRFEEAKELMEDAYIHSGYLHEEIIEELYKGLKKVNDREIRIRLHEKLGDLDYRCRAGNSLIQLIAFLSFCFKVPHLSRCPVLREGK